MTIWNISDYSEKQRLQYLVFPKGMTYDRLNDTVLTSEVNSIFARIAYLTKVMGGLEKPQADNSALMSALVGVAGLEPTASTSRTWHATNCATPRIKKR